MRKRVIGMVVSVALAAAGTFAILTYVKRADERALAGQETVSVLVVERPVPRGTPVADVAGAVTTQQVPVAVLADGSVSSLASLEGTVAAVDLVPGEQVVATRFVEPVDLVTSRVVDIPDGYLEVTVALDPQRSVGGQPIPGDLVAVVASFNSVVTPTEDTGEGQVPGQPVSTTTEEDEATLAKAATHIILHKVLVANIQSSGSTERTAEPADITTAAYAAAPSSSLLITFALPAPDVERLVYAAEHGRIWLAREPIDAPEDGTQIQTARVIFR